MLADKMASKNRPKVLVTRGDHDPGALQRLTKVADVEVTKCKYILSLIRLKTLLAYE